MGAFLLIKNCIYPLYELNSGTYMNPATKHADKAQS